MTEHFRLPSRGPAAQRRIAQGGIHSHPSMEIALGAPGKQVCRGAGKKKMRTLGTVQLPTEAFMAVLKLDEE